MVLEGNFYKIIKTDKPQEDSYAIEVELNPEHEIYKGHFPEQPVVPGVCTLTIVRECLSKVLGKDVVFEAIKECKYISALIPEENLRIILNLKIVDSTGVRGTVVRSDNQEIVIKLRATLR